MKALIFTASEGHKSISTAVSQILEQNNWQTKTKNYINQKKITKTAFNIYRSIYKYTPQLNKLPYKTGQNTLLQSQINKFLKDYFAKEIKKEITDLKPQVVITTHFAYNPAVSSFVPKNIKKINIIPNPWTIHPLEIQPGMKNFAYDQKAAALCRKMNLPEKDIIISGWFIRQQFYQNQNKEIFLKSIGFDPKILTLLICGGSEGSNTILTILPMLASLKTPLQLTIVCGNNKLLYNSLKVFLKTIPITSKNVKINLVGFTDQMPQYIQSSHLVIGKAGPNLVFEATACNKPFFAICHISGQEDGNLDVIKKKKIGFVEENPLKAGKLLKKIIEKPDILRQFEKHITKERKNNQKSKKVLLKNLKI